MTSTVPFALYNPALLSADTLLGEFIARRPLLETLIDTVRQNLAGHAQQHVLLVGARGMGKTTSLWAVAHSITRDAVLAREWQPVVFDEESRRIGDLADFWLEAIRQWEHASKDRSNRTKALLDQDAPDIEDRARQVFLDLITRSKRRALLLIDNLNDVLASISAPESLHRLRAFLMDESRVMVIGGATRYFPQITDVDQPFYDFFRVFELKPLSLDEMKACLLSLAQTRGDAAVQKTVQEREGTMRSLHLLTGGNPRLIKTFYRLLAEGLRGDIRADMERLLDEFTPYFKSIVDALPTQQQRIFDAVALNWDPVDVSTIAHATRLPSNQVSAQLRALVKGGHVAEPAGHPKRKLYLLTDRFSNIHYLMRHGRAARNRFDWFVAMLRLVFPDQSHAETFAKVTRRTAECGPDGMRDARDLLHSALSRSESANSRRQLLQATFRESWDNDAFNSFSNWFDVTEARQHLPESDILAFFQQIPTDLRKKVGFNPDSARWWCRLTDFLKEKSAWALAEDAYRKAIELDPKDAYPWLSLGRLLRSNLQRPEEAERAFRNVIELEANNAYSWILLGNLLVDELGRSAEAEPVLRRAVELDPSSSYAWISLGDLLGDHLGRPEEAEIAFRKAIEHDTQNLHSVFAWTSLGTLLAHSLNRPEEAESAFRIAIEKDPTDDYPWTLLGNCLQYYRGQLVEAESAYLKAIELAPKSGFAWAGLGSLLQNSFHRPREAEAAYRRAIENDAYGAFAWASLARLLAAQDDRHPEARVCAINALGLDPSYESCRNIFNKVSGNVAEDWRAVLPGLALWSATKRKSEEVFEFTINGFIQLSRLTKPTEALAVLDNVKPEAAAAFETLRDAIVAHDDLGHLDRIAPERRVVAIELLNRLHGQTIKHTMKSRVRKKVPRSGRRGSGR
jgi:tetratricopeptide (TPR) repeat protein